MSCSLDVNILIYASDKGSEYFTAASDFLETLAEGNEPVYIPWITVMSYLRIATHPRIFSAPLSAEEAEANMGAFLSLSIVRPINELDNFWSVYKEITSDKPIRANLVPDAHLAAVLKQHGIRTLYTHDKDFRRFPFLEVIDPLVPKGS